MKDNRKEITKKILALAILAKEDNNTVVDDCIKAIEHWLETGNDIERLPQLSTDCENEARRHAAFYRNEWGVPPSYLKKEHSARLASLAASVAVPQPWDNIEQRNEALYNRALITFELWQKLL